MTDHLQVGISSLHQEKIMALRIAACLALAAYIGHATHNRFETFDCILVISALLHLRAAFTYHGGPNPSSTH
jgi:hypothetical protein